MRTGLACIHEPTAVVLRPDAIRMSSNRGCKFSSPGLCPRHSRISIRYRATPLPSGYATDPSPYENAGAPAISKGSSDKRLIYFLSLFFILI
ncbi:hypothetical protein ECP_3781 [Escherichia coli 536]|uniref:Uncharacterized protein n=1 Tax=Escherichia coli O6:K15:H31 (strain 536 / UPEC) TaxID=362663 RepID=A0A454A9B2_ECOL5|nr:hypothetical protein ECP_3781 [Escherichia coli 536]